VDATGHARITDFGIATVIGKMEPIRSDPVVHGNAARWTAPEILSGGVSFSKEADIFSFAMVMIEVSYERAIFVALWLTATPYYRRGLPAQLRSGIRHPWRPYWQ